MDLNSQSIVVAIIFIAGVVAARPLIKANIWTYRKLHLKRFADCWQGAINPWVAVVRVVCSTGAVLFVLRGFEII